MKFILEIMTATALAALVALSAAHAAPLSEDAFNQLAAQFDTLDGGMDDAAVNAVVEALSDRSLQPADVRDFFRRYFADSAAPSTFGPLWRRLTTISNANAAVVVHASTICATEALRKSLVPQLHEDPRLTASAISALLWLEEVGPLLNDEVLAETASSLAEVVGSAGSNGFGGLIPAAGMQTVDRADKAILGIQLCLTVSDYLKERNAVSSTLRLNNAARLIWDSYGVFIFDNNLYDALQISSLQSLLASIPRELHEVHAIIVPEGTGVDPARPQIATARQIIYLAPIPMGQYTDPGLFDKSRHTAPRFTVTAVHQFVEAIQILQYQRRPYLAARRGAILAQSGLRRQMYLHRFVDPSVYAQAPNLLLPHVAELYFVNTPATFDQALTQFNLGFMPPLNSFLLLADVMSGGESRTVGFTINEFGIVSTELMPVGRTLLGEMPLVVAPGTPPNRMPSPVINPISSLGILSSVWRFALNANGDAYAATR